MPIPRTLCLKSGSYNERGHLQFQPFAPYCSSNCPFKSFEVMLTDMLFLCVGVFKRCVVLMAVMSGLH